MKLTVLKLRSKKDTGIGPVRGFSDLTLRKSGDSGILDFKWGRKNDRKKLLEKGRATQLAAYSELAGSYLPTGFFIIQNAELLTVHPDFFPGGTALSGPGEKDVWENVEKAVGLIRKESKAGNVPVGIPENASDTGLYMLPSACKYCEYGMFCRIEERPS